MTFETKEQVLESMMSGKRPNCPNCQKEMQIWEVPPITFSDGLGWGSPYLYLCFNDDCPLYVSGWDNIKEHYSHHASYRCFCYPDKKNFEVMPVFSPVGATGQIITDQAIAEEEALKAAIKKGFSILAGCYTEKDWATVMRILLDPTEPVRVRLKAAEIVGDFAELEAVEPLRSAKFGNQKLQEEVAKAIGSIHVRYFTRECPLCAEIIKKRAKICKHCGETVAGC